MSLDCSCLQRAFYYVENFQKQNITLIKKNSSITFIMINIKIVDIFFGYETVSPEENLSKEEFFSTAV